MLETVHSWQERPLASLYPIIWMGKVKSDGRYIHKVIYIVLGLNLSGQKEVLGIWIDKTESVAFWMKVLDNLKQRGVDDIFIAATDNLSGFSESIKVVYPDSM